MTAAAQFKITYTSADMDMTEFHRLFDEAVVQVKAQAGRDHPLHINGRTVRALAQPLVLTSPIDGSVLGRFSAASRTHVDQAVKAAKASQKAWARRPWRERVGLLRGAAALIRERKYELAAVMSLEVGKSRMEAMGDAEESADLIDYYCQQVSDAGGFTRPLGKLSPNEDTKDVLVPYGVFVCIAPFNFPLALSAGMSSAALVAGNALVYKPSPETPWTGLRLTELYADAGIPAGVFNFITGRDEEIGDPLWKHPLVDGVVFTGSKAVGMRIYQEFSRKWIKPVLMELGGKNAAIVTESADLDMAAEGVMRSAFGLQGQKCSACSRVYVDKRVADAFTQKLLAKTAAIRIGDPSQKDVYLGPIINEASVQRYEKAVKLAKKGILAGGKRLKEGALADGHYVAPTVAKLPLDHELFRRELFLPFVVLGVVDGLDQAIAETNKADYGLTAGIFSAKREEIDRFFDEVEAGVCYANRKTGATTGAWPGVQSFCGWKGSGASGKGGCGPYYVAQFMREQSRTVME